MPLLVCPNDSAAMQSVQRHGVEFDFCPTCRGVWLDRGELEKLMAGSRDESGYDAPPPAPRREERDYRAYDERGGYDDRRRDRRDDDDDRYRPRKRRGFDLFDIFD